MQMARLFRPLVYRANDNEQWEFDGYGLMRRREARINDLAIAPEDRKFPGPAGPRPAAITA
jgi:uncharacterized protein